MKREKLFNGFSKKGVLFVCLLSLLLFTTSAWADLYSFNLIYANPDLNGGAIANYAQVTVNRTDGYNATITFDALTGWDLGAQLGVEVNSTGFTATPSEGNSFSGSLDGFGKFNASFKNNSNVDQFIITLVNTSLTAWGSAQSVLTFNGSGMYAAAHIKPEGMSGTGFAAGNGNPVPLPGAVWLLGSGLIGIVAIRRRKAA